MASHHGEFYTDFDYQMAPQKINVSKGGEKAKYKLRGGTTININGGNGELSYKTHHGDVFIEKN